MDKTISCIIINTFNNEFVKKRTIPSIINTTKTLNGWDVEIIVVDNNPNNKFKINETDNIKVIKSEPYHLPKAFNCGVKHAKYKYIAIFHDDCEMLDYNWVIKTTNQLNDHVYATSPELYTNAKPYKVVSHTDYLKEVPLVMERSKFNEIGGYDETYYWGFEDVIFSSNIFKKGKTIKQTPLNYLHFNGMSTMILQLENDKEITKKRLREIKNKFLEMKTIEEFTKFKDENTTYIKVKTKSIIDSFFVRVLMFLKNKSTYTLINKDIGVNLGYIQTFTYWGTTTIPTEIMNSLMPRTKQELKSLMDDIKGSKNGKLYSKLEKYKNKHFKKYFN